MFNTFCNRVSVYYAILTNKPLNINGLLNLIKDYFLLRQFDVDGQPSFIW